jgi:hypothetical protein
VNNDAQLLRPFFVLFKDSINRFFALFLKWLVDTSIDGFNVQVQFLHDMLWAISLIRLSIFAVVEESKCVVEPLSEILVHRFLWRENFVDASLPEGLLD